MNMKFYRKLPIPMQIKANMPLPKDAAEVRKRRVREIKDVLSGTDRRLLLIIGPCSADREDAVMEYLYRLKRLEERVSERILIVPRIYTGKPRTTGEGYLGMLHQPDPDSAPDLLLGIEAIRRLHIRAISECGFGCADEMLYPENHRYLSDLLAYTTVGARSAENQQHRLTASGLDIPVGIKNPMCGSIGVLMNSIRAAQAPHVFCYRGWEVGTEGNPYAHAILRGFVTNDGTHIGNYDKKSLTEIAASYLSASLATPAIIVDTNHSNSKKRYEMQPEIALDVMRSRREDDSLGGIIRGLMIESYLENGCRQDLGEAYGRSITDPCLGWSGTEELVLKIAELV